MSTAWNYVGFFGVMAWLLFSYGTGIKFDRFQVHGGWVVTVLGLVSGILAGLAALGTPIYSFVGAIAHSFTPVSFALFLGVVVAVGLTVLALLPDKLHGFTAGLGLALAWIVIPTLLRQGVVPAPAGPHIQAVLVQLTQPIVANTRWFG
jgi:hypothetical protein